MNCTSYKNVFLALAVAIFALDRAVNAQVWAAWPPNLNFSGSDDSGREQVSHNHAATLDGINLGNFVAMVDAESAQYQSDYLSQAKKKPAPASPATAGGSGGTGSAKPPAKPPGSGGGGNAGSGTSSGASKQPPASQPTSTWTLVLNTFTDGDHEQAAQTMMENLQRIAPDVASGSRVHTGSKGSMVIFGNYSGRDDAKAKTDQERLKNVMYQNRPLFNRVILTRIDLRSQGPLPPNDLLNVRRKYPKINPLYTLDVAMWMANEDRTQGDVISYDQVRQKAEDYAQKLRGQGHEAYFYHDDENQRSIVTVGVFDRRAVDATSGLFSSDVKALIKKFPARLVNGEPLQEFKDPLHPKAGAKPQEPKLVLVPEL
jgi:hypothetical protein